MFPESSTAVFPLQLHESVLKCFMHLFSPSNQAIVPNLLHPGFRMIYRNDMYASFLLLPLMLCTFFH